MEAVQAFLIQLNIVCRMKLFVQLNQLPQLLYGSICELTQDSYLIRQELTGGQADSPDPPHGGAFGDFHAVSLGGVKRLLLNVIFSLCSAIQIDDSEHLPPPVAHATRLASRPAGAAVVQAGSHD